jgi:hypothetical protein
MKDRVNTALKWLLLALPLLPVARAQTPVTPLPRAHAHNDYAHARPLFDALARGFCSVEADIHLVDGALLVAHDRHQVKPDRTLRALYLDPLQARARANGGRIYPDGPPFYLLIDLKSDGAATWPVLRATLRRYPNLLTEFRGERVLTNAVTVILSGNSPRALLAREPVRRAAIDGRPPDLERNPSPALVPWISESWGRLFSWRGNGPFPPAEQARLADLLRRAHAQGRKVRFWGAPDFPGGWNLEWEAGVDFINTDRLAALRTFLLEKAGEKPAVSAP